VGARFNDVVDLASAALDRDLSVICSIFAQGLDLREFRSQGSLSLDESRILGRLNMEGAQIERNLNMSEVVLGAEKLDEGMRLVGATIKGNLALWDASISGPNMDSVSVGGHLFMSGRRGRAHFWRVWLQNAKIGGELSMQDADVHATLKMNGVSVGATISLLNSSFTDIEMRDAKVGRDLYVEGPKNRQGEDPRRSLDLSGATIGGALELGSAWYGVPDWPEDTSLTLRSTAVFELRDGIVCASPSTCDGRWPRRLELDGFRYQQLEAKDTDMAARPASWWARWLANQERYSPQPYEQLSSVLVKLGYKEKAKDVLYEGKNRELEAAGYPEKLLLALQCALIGYGYRLDRTWWWVTGLVLLGAIMLRLSGQGLRHNMPFGIAYSFDMLLPIVRLRDAHYKVDLTGWARYYFYFHKVMGYVLASFLIAGLAGLTK